MSQLAPRFRHVLPVLSLVVVVSTVMPASAAAKFSTACAAGKAALHNKHCAPRSLPIVAPAPVELPPLLVFDPLLELIAPSEEPALAVDPAPAPEPELVLAPDPEPAPEPAPQPESGLVADPALEPAPEPVLVCTRICTAS